MVNVNDYSNTKFLELVITRVKIILKERNAGHNMKILLYALQYLEVKPVLPSLLRTFFFPFRKNYFNIIMLILCLQHF